jgi:hypothetical protein
MYNVNMFLLLNGMETHKGSSYVFDFLPYMDDVIIIVIPNGDLLSIVYLELIFKNNFLNSFYRHHTFLYFSLLLKET